MESESVTKNKLVEVMDYFAFALGLLVGCTLMVSWLGWAVLLVHLRRKK